MGERFRGILVTKPDDTQKVEITEIDSDDLPEGDVTVAVEYSTVNYKDGLAITGRSPIIRRFPMVPGIDLAGTVEHGGGAFKPGDKVLVNGYGLSETYWGGYARKARLKSEWLVPIPAPFDSRHAMAIGTAGYTAMLCVLGLEDHGIAPGSSEILVTGASGGVGSTAIAILAKLGYRVVASTGSLDQSDWLKELGASEVIDRKELSEPGRPLGKERWAGVVDAVGSHTLANALATTKYGGAVAACGLAQGADLPTSVMPFILRGVTLVGIDSVMAPMDKRRRAWERLARDLDPAVLDRITTAEIGLDGVPKAAEDILAARIEGRVVVNLNR
jgi:acrylyl-CoA reductase (NADPH)